MGNSSDDVILADVRAEWCQGWLDMGLWALEEEPQDDSFAISRPDIPLTVEEEVT